MSGELDHVFANSDYVLVLPNLRIDDVSAASGSFIVGPPSPVALCGFAHRVGLDALRDGIADITIRFVSICIHDFSIATGHVRIPPEMRGESRDKAGAMLDEPVGRLQCSLLVGYDVKDDDTSNTDREALIADWMASTLQKRRLSGGRFISGGLCAGSTIGVTVSRRALVCRNEDDLIKTLRALPAGSFLADRSDLMQPTGDQRDSLDMLLDAVARVQVHDERSRPNAEGKPRAPTSWRRNQKGSVVPIDIGYRALSKTVARSGLRMADGIEGHAWVEGVMSIGEWVPKGRVIHTGLRGCLWHYCPQESEFIWTVAARE